jgi:serine/threonine protein kinase
VARLQVQRLADQKLYALKRVDISEKGTNDINDLLCEIRILASFNHPRIVRWFETFVGEREIFFDKHTGYAQKSAL